LIDERVQESEQVMEKPEWTKTSKNGMKEMEEGRKRIVVDKEGNGRQGIEKVWNGMRRKKLTKPSEERKLEML